MAVQVSSAYKYVVYECIHYARLYKYQSDR